ncbi:MAG: polysaccharide biosynthesis/export family protein [Cyanobacteria bacterium P01_H01_bin.15]
MKISQFGMHTWPKRGLALCLLIGFPISGSGLPVLAQRDLPPFEEDAPPLGGPESTDPAILPPATFDVLSPPPVLDPVERISDDPEDPFNTYHLDEGDQITIQVEEFPEFSASVLVSSEGEVVLPILGRLSVRGLTLDELETKVSYELGTQYLQEAPIVIANLITTRPVRLTILGEVFRPGYYQFGSQPKILDVLAQVGGSSQDADLREVIIRRKFQDGTRLERTIDLYSPLQSATPPPELTLQPEDTIIIPRLQVAADEDYDRLLVARSTLPQQVITVRIISPVGTGNAIREINLPSGSTFFSALSTLPQADVLLISRNVALLRFDQDQGRVIKQMLRANSLRKGDLSQDVPLQNNDVLVVNRTLIGKIFNTIDIVTRPIRDIYAFFRFFDDISDGRFGRRNF